MEEKICGKGELSLEWISEYVMAGGEGGEQLEYELENVVNNKFLYKTDILGIQWTTLCYG